VIMNVGDVNVLRTSRARGTDNNPPYEQCEALLGMIRLWRCGHAGCWDAGSAHHRNLERVGLDGAVRGTRERCANGVSELQISWTSRMK
jgi:hypothetical protein